MQLQDDFVQFAAAQEMEQQQCANIMGRLRMFAREFFQVDREAEVVRPLALLLGYINGAAGQPLEARAGDACFLALEGAVGQLELFHACPQLPFLTIPRGFLLELRVQRVRRKANIDVGCLAGTRDGVGGKRFT